MRTAVLLSGGLDSAVLVAEEAARGNVQPIYVSVGLAWEDAERETIARLLESGVLGSSVQPLAALAVDMTDVYPSGHWALEGRPPGYHTADEDVYLPGRNIVLLSKADVIRRGVSLGLPLDLTLSCMNPALPAPPSPPRHCGLCSKCRERHDAFLEAGVPDPTDYANRRHVDLGKSEI